MFDIRIQTSIDNQSGFIALMATLIIAVVLSMFMFSTNLSSFFAHFDALGSENKRISLALSEACVNSAVLKIAQNYNYTVDWNDPDWDYIKNGVVLKIGSNECLIKSVTYSQIGSIDPNIQKTATINANAQYPAVNGSWSASVLTINVRNPKYSMVDIISY